MFAIPKAWYKHKGNRDQKQNDDDDTDGPDPGCYITQKKHKTEESENIIVYKILCKRK